MGDNLVIDRKQAEKLKSKVAILKRKIASGKMEIIGSTQQKQQSAKRIVEKMLEIDSKLPS